MGKCKIMTGGGMTGRCVWKKYDSYTPARTMVVGFSFVGRITGALPSQKYIVFQVNLSAGFSYSDLKNSMLIGHKFIQWVCDGRTYTGTFDTATLCYLGPNRVSWGYSPSNGQILVDDFSGIYNSIDSNSTYYNKSVAFQEEYGNLLGYVISDNPDMYPSKGMKGNYFYELLGSAPQATSYGITETLTMSIKDDAITEVQEEIKNGNV